jgi:hypothetical protein
MLGFHCEARATSRALAEFCFRRAPPRLECKGPNAVSEAGENMRVTLWMLFFVVCNLIGVAVFKAAMTLPFQEALLPRILTVPLVGLAALGATRVLSAMSERDK